MTGGGGGGSSGIGGGGGVGGRRIVDLEHGRDALRRAFCRRQTAFRPRSRHHGLCGVSGVARRSFRAELSVNPSRFSVNLRSLRFCQIPREPVRSDVEELRCRPHHRPGPC